MNDRRSMNLRPISRRFTTLEGWHEVREGVFSFGQRTLVLGFADQFDLERDHNDTTSFAPSDENNEMRLSTQPEKPYHVYTSNQRWMVVILISAAGLFSGLSSNIYFPSLDAIAKDLHVRTQDVNLTITSYLIVQAISPLLWGSLSDILGRRPIYVYSFLVYIVSNTVLSFSPNFTVLLLFRALQAAGSASTVSIGNGVIQDMIPASERGGFMSFYQAIRNFSIAGGPVIGGILTKFLGFRSIFIFLLIISSITILAIVLFLPETLRSIAGDGSLPLAGIHQPLIRRLMWTSDDLVRSEAPFVRPPIMLRTFFEPLLLLKQKGIVLNLVFGSVVYAIWSMVTSSTTALFHQSFRLNELQLGLVFVPNGLGTIFGSMVIGILMDRSFKQAEADYRSQHDPSSFLGAKENSLPANFPIERARLKHIPWITTLFVVSTAAYGFSLNSRSLAERPGWIAVPLILQFFIAATSNAVFAINQTLVSDLCPGKGASSTAINNLFRCSVGAVGVAFIDTMISAMGVGPAFAGLGLVTIIVSPLCVIQWYWAMSWRAGRMSSK